MKTHRGKCRYSSGDEHILGGTDRNFKRNFERLNAESTLYKALIGSTMAYAYPARGIRGGQPPFKLAVSAKRSFPHSRSFTKANTDPRFARGV